MVFLFLLLLILILGILLRYSKLRIQIKNVKFTSQTTKHLEDDYKIKIQICILNKIPIFQYTISQEKIKKSKAKEKIQMLEEKYKGTLPKVNRKIFGYLKEMKITMKDINLYMDLGTENAAFTALLVPCISTILMMLLQRKTITCNDNIYFKINPMYVGKNLINLAFSGIFEIKMYHIINIIKILGKEEKKGVKENERTSNRGTYDYSYE